MRREIGTKMKVETLKKQMRTMKWRWTGQQQTLGEEEEGGLKRLKGLVGSKGLRESKGSEGSKGLKGSEGSLCEQSRSSSDLRRRDSGLPPRIGRTLVMINTLIIKILIMIMMIMGIMMIMIVVLYQLCPF